MLYLLAEHITYVVLLPRLTTTLDSVVSNFSRFRKGKQGASRLFLYHLLTDVLPFLDITKPVDLQYKRRRRGFEQICVLLESWNSHAYFYGESQDRKNFLFHRY